MSILSKIIMNELKKAEDSGLSAGATNESIESQNLYTDVSCNECESNNENANIVSEPCTSTGKIPLFELENELCKKNDFIVTNDLLYHYNPKVHYYELVNQDDVIFLYRSSVNQDLNGATSLGRYKDLYKFLKTDPKLKKTTYRNTKPFYH